MYNIRVYTIIFIAIILPCTSFAGLISNFDNGNPSCHSCHAVSNINSITDGYMSIVDISSTMNDFGDRETLMEFINTSNIPIMMHAYSNKLTLKDIEQLEQEYSDITGVKPSLFEKHIYNGLLISLISIIILRLVLHKRRLKDE